MSPPRKLVVGGRRFWIVPSESVEAWDDDLAARRLRDCAGEWLARNAILRLSAALGGPDDDLERAIACIVRALARGEILAMRVDEDFGGLEPALSLGDESPTRWDDLPSLSDLLPVRPEPPTAPSPWSEPPPPAVEPATPFSLPEPPRPPAETQHFVAFTVTDVDGAALRGTWDCTIGEQGELGDTEVRFEPLAPATEVALSFRPVGYLAPSRPAFAPSDESTMLARAEHVVDVADELGPLALPLDRTSHIVVRVPKATVFTLPAYDLDLEVFRPGWLWFDEHDAHGISGIGCVAQALAYARAHPERHVLVVGHTDTTGTKSHNRGVAERRASHLAALLRADVEGWVASCSTDGTLADLSAHVQWAARRFGWPCDPGVVEHETAAFRAALATWREHAAEITGLHVAPDAKASAEDWRIAYALLDVALAEELDLDLAELAELRAGLRLCEPPIVGAGELWPRELVGKNGVASAMNRRTEILFATVDRVPGGAGSPAGTSIYGDDAWLWLDYIDPEPRAALPIGLVSSDGHPVADTPFKLVSASGRVRFGRLGPEAETCIEDVAAGAFQVHWTDPDDITAKVWAARCDAALKNRDVSILERIFDRAPTLVQAVSQAWSTRFGDGGPDGLARAARAMVAGSSDELPIDYLLAEAGFPDHVKYESAAVAAETSQ